MVDWGKLKYLKNYVESIAEKRMDDFTVDIKFFQDGDFTVSSFERIDNDTFKQIVNLSTNSTDRFVVFYQFFGPDRHETEFITEFDFDELAIGINEEKEV